MVQGGVSVGAPDSQHHQALVSCAMALEAVPLLEGPIDTEHWCSMGFKTTDEKAPASLRGAVQSVLWHWEVTDRDFNSDVSLVVSELSTNAVEHTSDAYHSASLTIWLNEGMLLIAVHDRSKKAVDPHPEDEGGRGLILVNAICADWYGYVETSPDWDGQGKVVKAWLQLPKEVESGALQSHSGSGTTCLVRA